MYEGTQLCRNLETEIRKAKDTQVLAKASLPTAKEEDLPKIKDEILSSQKRITELTRSYRELNKISGLPSKLERAKASGYKRVKTS